MSLKCNDACLESNPHKQKNVEEHVPLVRVPYPPMLVQFNGTSGLLRLIIDRPLTERSLILIGLPTVSGMSSSTINAPDGSNMMGKSTRGAGL